MILLNGATPTDLMYEIAANVKQRRLELNLSQKALSEKAGMKLPTYIKFEQTGKISLESLLHVAFALDCIDDFKELFIRKQYETIENVIESTSRNRKRASKK